jgi:hypothetical protein
LVSFLPGILLLLLSLTVLISFIQALVTNPQLFQQFMSQVIVLVLMLGLLWWMYARLPGIRTQGIWPRLAETDAEAEQEGVIGFRAMRKRAGFAGFSGALGRAAEPGAVPGAPGASVSLQPALPCRQLPQAAPSPLGLPLGVEAVARLIGCSPWTVRQRLMPQGLPHFRAGASGKLIFYTNQVVAWIRKRQGGMLP